MKLLSYSVLAVQCRARGVYHFLLTLDAAFAVRAKILRREVRFRLYARCGRQLRATSQ
jgi:hypothetical protein